MIVKSFFILALVGIGAAAVDPTPPNATSMTAAPSAGPTPSLPQTIAPLMAPTPKPSLRAPTPAPTTRRTVVKGPPCTTCPRPPPAPAPTPSPIAKKYDSLGGASGILGPPEKEEKTLPDGEGRYRRYVKGSIYWHPNTGANYVYGLIREKWAELGWETNPDFGYPISDEKATFDGSKHRFSDFENGLLYLKSGSSTAVIFPKSVGSQSAAQVFAIFKKEIDAFVQKTSRAYYKKDPTLAEVMDYSWDGSKVINRSYRIKTELGLDIKGLRDPSIKLEFQIRISFDRKKNTVWASLYSYKYNISVPWLTSKFISAKEIASALEAVLDPMLGVQISPNTLPSSVRLLSAKVMPNGDLSIYWTKDL